MSVASASATTTTPSSSRRNSYQAAAFKILSQQRKELGYTPFEYWKGPKPVIPGVKPTLGPVATRRTTTIAVTAVDTSSTSKAQRSAAAAAVVAIKIQEVEDTDKEKKEYQPTVSEKRVSAYSSYSLSSSVYSTDKMGWTDTYSNGPGDRTAGPNTFQVHDHNGAVELVSGSPPSYDSAQLPPRAMKSQSKWDPRGWRKRTWAGIALVVIIAIVAGVVAGVLVAKANRYPDYSKLSYTLADTYSGTDFFDNFDYFEGYDPSSGFVHYVPATTAETLNLTYASSSSAVLRVDTSVGNTSSPDASTGRFSVRVTSKTQYDSGLFIFDVKHTPYGCGTWPALWLTDTSNWPTNGEIDVMEAVNLATDGNQMTLHTTGDCDMDVKRKMSGTAQYDDCHNTTNSNAGCGVLGSTSSYGSKFNAAGGGVMALEWRDAGIRMWQFGRDSIPDDITAGSSPDPSSWGTASADFPNTDCSISSHFRNQSIIANIDLCGSWAGNVYADSGCPSSCEDYVANYPSAFTNAYWEFSSFSVYKAS